MLYTNYLEKVLIDSPFALWSLGETSGTTASNQGSLGSAITATYGGSPTLGATSLIDGSNKAINFDGIDDGVFISNHASLNSGTSYSQRTIELWFNADTVSGKRTLYEEGGTGNGFNLYLDGNQLKMGAWANNSGAWLSQEIKTAQTYHVVFVFDQGTIKGYVNNELIGTTQTGFVTMPTHGSGVSIGQVNGDTRWSNTETFSGSGAYFDGTIDEVALYNTALASDRVEAHYSAAGQLLSNNVYNNALYVLSDTSTWEIAQAQAKTWGGNLTTINTANEETWLKETFGTTKSFWTGLTDKVTEGTFKWISGETSTYRNFATGEPNDSGGNEDYVGTNWGTQKQWNDYGSTSTLQGIVEIPLYSYNGHGYFLSSAGTWEEVKTIADRIGGKLVTINDASEEAWLKQTFGDSESFWIGLTDKDQEAAGNGAAFQWVSGEESSYRNFATGEPNDYGGAEDYVGMNWGTQKKWNDYSSTTKLRAIIEVRSYYEVHGTAANDDLVGDENVAVNNLMYGHAGDDTLRGDLGDDTILGGGGADKLMGNEGLDTLTGGDGIDHFIFGSTTEGIDTITDFNAGQGDRIQVSASFGATKLSDFSFNGTTGALSFQGTQFATLQGLTTFDIATNIIIHQNFTLKENSANGSSVGSAAINNPATTNPYKIASGNSNGAFTINAATGAISVADKTKLNFEDTTQKRYELFVEAKDNTGKTQTRVVTIQITDVNETPIANNQSFSIAENTLEGVKVGQIAASDPDTGSSTNSRLHYQILSGNTSGAFSIDRKTGDLYVADHTQLDYETKTSHQLTIQVTDGGGLKDTAIVTVNILDGNEAPVIADQAFYLKDVGVQIGKGSTIGTVAASDENTGQALTYSITSGNSEGYFTIDSATGVLKINSAISSTALTNLIASNTTSRSLTVKVTDSLGLSDTATVSLDNTVFDNLYSQTGSNNPFNGLDFGNDANLTFADMDGDGDLDAVVAGGDNSGIKYYQNNGGTFTQKTGSSNPFDSINDGDSLVKKGITGAGFTLSPNEYTTYGIALGDIDTDGDLDLFVGSGNGTSITGSGSGVSYYQNNNGSFTSTSLSGIPTSGLLNPGLVDINNDGKLDIITGDTAGTLSYYQNNGNNSFTQKTGTANPFNGIDVGYDSKPTFADMDNDGDADAVIGEDSGNLNYFQNNGNATFTEKTGNANPFNGIDIGSTSAPAIADTNSDGYADLIIGESDGTLNYYKGAQTMLNLSFSTSGQSTWSSGDSIYSANTWQPFSPVTWNTSPSVDLGFLDINLETSGSLGFKAGYEFDTGSVAASLPFEVYMNGPQQVSVGDSVTISTSYSMLSSASFSTTTPHVSAYAGFDLSLYLGAKFGIDVASFGTSWDYRGNKGLNIDEFLGYSFDSRQLEGKITPFEGLDFTFNSPDTGVQSSSTGTNSLSGSSEDVFLEAELSFDDILVYMLETFGGSAGNAAASLWQTDIDAGVAGINWDLLDLDLIGDLSLEQNYDLKFDSLTGQMIFEDGSSQYFTVGNDVSFTYVNGMDKDNDGLLEYTTKFNVNNPTLTNKLDIGFDLNFDIAAVSGSAWYDFITSGSANFGPLYSDSFDLASGSMNIYNKTFSLGGFNTETQAMSLAIV